MKPKLLKFDIVHPQTYLNKKKEEWDDLEELSATEYRQRLISLRSNYSDFYTYHLNKLGWEAEEFFLLDDTYINKIGKELLGFSYPFKRASEKIKNKIRPARSRWKNKILQAYIEKFNPDVIFARSQPIPSNYWQKFRNDCLLVARLSARMPRHWHPDDWDLLYVDLDNFKTFFEAHDVTTLINRQGFDPRILSELQERPPQHEVTFVGGMGTQNFLNRTRFFEEIAEQTNFKWWGYWWKYGGWGSIDDFPHLKKSFQGPTSGLEMYQLYKDSKIVLNDYVDTSENIGFNQRMFEVMGVGGFMITREADNFSDQFPDNIFSTFSDSKDCITKISYYLQHQEEREKIGRNAKKFVSNCYNYKDIVREFDKELREQLAKKE